MSDKIKYQKDSRPINGNYLETLDFENLHFIRELNANGEINYERLSHKPVSIENQFWKNGKIKSQNTYSFQSHVNLKYWPNGSLFSVDKLLYNSDSINYFEHQKAFLETGELVLDYYNLFEKYGRVYFRDENGSKTYDLLNNSIVEPGIISNMLKLHPKSFNLNRTLFPKLLEQYSLYEKEES